MTMNSFSDLANFHLDALAKVATSMRQSCELTDIELVCNGKHFHAHKVMLATSSLFFRTMFSCDMQESKSQSITMDNLDPEILECVVDFAYTGKIGALEHDMEQLKQLLSAADYLQMDTLQQGCILALLRFLSEDNFVEFWDLSVKFSCKSMKQKVVNFIASQFSDLVSTKEYMKVCSECLIAVLSSPLLSAAVEQFLINDILEWVKHDLKNRIDALTEIAPLIIVSEIPYNNLFQLVEDDAVKACHELLRRIRLGLRQHFIRQDIIKTEEIEQIVVEIGLVGATPRFEVQYCNVDKSGPWSTIQVYRPNPFNSGFSMVAFGSTLYVMGGGLSNATTQVTTFNFTSGKWGLAADMLVGRSHAGVTTMGGYIYVVGGEGRYGQVVEKVERYDPSTDRWEMMAPLSNPRNFLSVAAAGGKLYAIGGELEVGFESYDPKTEDGWTRLALHPDLRKVKVDIFMTSYRDVLYIITANSASGIYTYDPATADWNLRIAPDLSARMTRSPEWISMEILSGQPARLAVIDLHGYVYKYNLRQNEWAADVCRSAIPRIEQAVVMHKPIHGGSTGDEME